MMNVPLELVGFVQLIVALGVEQRVKTLARELQTVVGVDWVDAGEVPTVQGLRARKENYLEALEHYHPHRVVNAS